VSRTPRLAVLLWISTGVWIEDRDFLASRVELIQRAEALFAAVAKPSRGEEFLALSQVPFGTSVLATSSMEDLLTELSEPYTREQFEEDRSRIIARLCAKHGVSEAELPALIREHRYEHSSEDPEDEYIQLMAIARATGWSPG